MEIPFTKMHGLGNDFVVVDNQSLEFRLTKPSVQKIADRRRGIGFDQLLTIEPARRNGDLFLDIKNPDGTVDLDFIDTGAASGMAGPW